MFIPCFYIVLIVPKWKMFNFYQMNGAGYKARWQSWFRFLLEGIFYIHQEKLSKLNLLNVTSVSYFQVGKIANFNFILYYFPFL